MADCHSIFLTLLQTIPEPTHARCSSQILSQFFRTDAPWEVRIKVIWGPKQTRCSTSAPKPLTLWTLVKQSRLDPRTPYSFTLDIITRTGTVRSRSLESRR